MHTEHQAVWIELQYAGELRKLMCLLRLRVRSCVRRASNSPRSEIAISGRLQSTRFHGSTESMASLPNRACRRVGWELSELTVRRRNNGRQRWKAAIFGLIPTCTDRDPYRRLLRFSVRSAWRGDTVYRKPRATTSEGLEKPPFRSPPRAAGGRREPASPSVPLHLGGARRRSIWVSIRAGWYKSSGSTPTIASRSRKTRGIYLRVEQTPKKSHRRGSRHQSSAHKR